MNENKKICSECGGKCCKRLPGEVWPEDVIKEGEDPKVSIQRLLKSGNYVIDCWEGHPIDEDMDFSAYFIRPRIVGENENRYYFESWGGQCVFLEENGCVLKYKDRPKTCRRINPADCGVPGKIIPLYKRLCAIEWLPYHDEICDILFDDFWGD